MWLSRPPLVPCPCRRLSHPRFIRGAHLHWTEIDGQTADLAVESERYLIVFVVDPGAGVEPDVEGLIGHLKEGNRISLLPGGNDLAVHLQDAAAALGNAGAVISVVEPD